IYNFTREQIVKMIDENPVIVVKGEPGCGKSTQVPQYIMEHYEGSKRGAHCNVIITQPRRLSAISLAEWVAFERQEKVGDVVGYQVRFKSAIPRAPGGVLLYCSTGILLRRIQNNPGLLGASHVVLDEAHERNINTDVLLVLLRRAIALNPELRVIVMSATINAELFRKYFDNAPVLSVPGFTYPVKSYFAEDLDILSTGNETTLCNPAINCSQVATVINWIDKHRPEGAILCFLPGWTEISSVLNYLEGDRSRIILPVHSRLSHEDQRRIFSNPPPGIRKIILATNIAETSITINDVVYVIDTGAQKEERLNIRLGVSTLGNQWVSQANVNQRKGRAGRVQPGECYHMYSRHTFENLNKFPIPELLRLPLEQTVLDCKSREVFSWAEGHNPSEIHKHMYGLYMEDCINRSNISRWCTFFADGHENLCDSPCSRRLVTATQQNVTGFEVAVLNDQQIQLRILSQQFNISYSAVYDIVHDTLKFHKSSAHWVPKNLTDDHKGQRMMTCLDHLRHYTAEGHDFLKGIVTGDDWTYHYTPETKQASGVDTGCFPSKEKIQSDAIC
ncbi:hypothetical protein ANN_22508, partial [Periplaneta americana]